MNIRQLQGYALILSAVLGVIGFFGPDTGLLSGITVVSVLLFIFGIPAVYTSQPIGTPGLIGVLLIMLAAVIALGFRLLDIDLNPTLEGILFWTSVVSGTIGRIIVGWLTTRQNVFPSWIGWALIAEGIMIPIPALADSLGSIVSYLSLFFGAVAELGYGYYLARVRPMAKPA